MSEPMREARIWEGSIESPWYDLSYEGPVCDAEDSGWLCTRQGGHPGRHLASFSRGEMIAAAWPGMHEPTAADLEEPAGFPADEISVERVRAHGQSVNESGIGCRVRHLETGDVAVVIRHRTYLENKAAAIELLRDLIDRPEPEAVKVANDDRETSGLEQATQEVASIHEAWTEAGPAVEGWARTVGRLLAKERAEVERLSGPLASALDALTEARGERVGLGEQLTAARAENERLRAMLRDVCAMLSDGHIAFTQDTSELRAAEIEWRAATEVSA